jgi:hypothetical protein
MITADLQHLIAMVVYMAAVIGIGIYFSKRANKDAESYFLGGRTLGPWVAAFSAEASDMSGWLLMGLPGLAYWTGLADAGWTAIGLAVGTYLNWLIVSKRLRRYSIQVDAITIPDFFSNRFHEKKKILMTISSVVTLVFFSVYAAQCLSTCGKLFSNLFGLSYSGMMIVAAVFVLTYTYLGGFLAESASDFMQAVVMIVTLVAVLALATANAGGVSAVVSNAKSYDGYYSLLTSASPSDTAVNVFGAGKSYSFLTICSTLAWGLGYFGMPQVLLRFMGIRSEKELPRSRRVAIVWCIISMTAAIAIGVAGRCIAGLDYTSNAAAEKYLHRHRHDLPAAPAGRSGLRRHTGRGHQLLRLVPADIRLGHQPEHLPRTYQKGRHGKAGHDVLPHHAGGHHHRGNGHRLEFQQHYLRHHRLRLGGLRRGLRPPDAVQPVLEAHHLSGRRGRYDLRRRDGLLLEAGHQSPGRRVGHILPAARLHRQQSRYRAGVPVHPGARRGHQVRVRRREAGHRRQ